MTISHINYWDQVNFWKNLWKFWNGPLCRYKSGPFLLLNVAGYWKSSNTEACAQKLSQILANNIDHGGRGIGLRIYVRYCRFNGVFSRDNFPNNNIKNRAYVINLLEYHDIGTHWVALFVNNKTIIYFDSFGVEDIPEEIMTFIGNKNIITIIFRIQAYDSRMCGLFLYWIYQFYV